MSDTKRSTTHPNDLIDAINKNLSQARAVSALAGLYANNVDEVPDDSLIIAMGLVGELIEDAKKFSHQLYDLAQHGQATLREVANG